MITFLLGFFLMTPRLPISTLFPYTTLFRSCHHRAVAGELRYRTDLFKGTAEYYRSEEHTSELQSRGHLVCRLLLEKKNGENWPKATSPGCDESLLAAMAEYLGMSLHVAYAS